MNSARRVYGTIGFASLVLVLFGSLMLFASPTWGSDAAAPYGAQAVTPLLFALPSMILGLVMVVLGLVGAIWAFFPALQASDVLERHIRDL
jgi:hypothetical protein